MTASNKKFFREQLLSQETNNPQLQEDFRREAKKMFTETLKKGQRLTYVLASLLIGLITLMFLAFAKIFEQLQMQEGLDAVEPLRLSLMWAMLLSAGVTLIFLWPALRGKVGLRFYPKVIRLCFWLLALAILAISIESLEFLEGVFDNVGIPAILTIFLFVLLAGVYLLLSGRIDRGDLETKAKMLELEFRIAELEKSGPIKKDRPTAGG
jgi:hypothetical protein